MFVVGSETRIFHAYLMYAWGLGVNRRIQIAQQRLPMAAVHIYQVESMMPAPLYYW